MQVNSFDPNFRFDNEESVDLSGGESIDTGVSTPSPSNNNNPSYQTTNGSTGETVETLDLSSLTEEESVVEDSGGTSIWDGFVNWCSNAWSTVKDFFVGKGDSLAETAAAIANATETVTGVLQASNTNPNNNYTQGDTKQVSLTEEDIAGFVGKMSTEEYDEFITGVESYYDEQLEFLNTALDGDDGLVDMHDRLINFNIQTNAEEVVFHMRQNVDEQTMYYYFNFYNNGTADFEQYGITFEDYEKMEFDAQLDFIKTHEPYMIELIAANEAYMNDVLDPQVKEQLGDLGISTFAEYEKLRDDTNAQIELIREMIQNTKNFQASAKYDYLYYLEDYKNFDFGTFNIEDYKDGISSLSDLDDLSVLAEISDKLPNFAKTFAYLYNQDHEKAKQFLKDCKYEINNVKGQLMASDFLDGLGVADGEHDGLDAVANELGVSVQGLADGLDSFGRGVYYSIEALMVGLGIMEENRVMSPNEYKKMYILQGLLSEKAKEDMGLIYKDDQGIYHNSDPNSIIDYTTTYAGPVLSNNYEISQGIGNMLPSIIASYFCPLAGSIMLGVSSGGNAYHSAMVDGQSYLSALMYGVFTGTSEAVTERLLGGLPGLSEVQVTSLKTYLQAMAREGFQEGFQGVMDSIYQAAFMGKPLPQTVEEWEAYGKDILKQSAYGAITAGILQSPALIASLSVDTSLPSTQVDAVTDVQAEAVEQIMKPAEAPDYFEGFDGLVKTDVSEQEIQRLARRFGVSETEVKQVLDAKLQQVFNDGEFGSRVSYDTLEKILFGDGMLKNQFETGTSDGLNNPEVRRSVEEAIFGVPRDLPAEERPIYGMLFPSPDDPGFSDYVTKGPGWWYGGEDGVVVIFDKAKVIDATSYTIGDSLDYDYEVSPGRASDPSFDSGFDHFGNGFLTIEDLQDASIEQLFNGGDGDEYLELQIHGSDAHSIENVKQVVFTKGAPSQAVLDRLTSLGIDYKIIN